MVADNLQTNLHFGGKQNLALPQVGSSNNNQSVSVEQDIDEDDYEIESDTDDEVSDANRFTPNNIKLKSSTLALG